MWTEPILHVDMDAFFVEVERLTDPGLRGVPVAVGGTGNRGVIASASYEARRLGVRSAQPTAIALRLCPQLKVIHPDHHPYAQASEQVFEIFRSFTPHVEGLSLDEAFLDVSGLRRHYPTPVEVAAAVRSAIRDQIGLPSSVGVAATKFMLCRTEWFKRYEEKLLEAYKANVWPLGADFEPHWCLVLSLDTRLAAIV